MCKLLAMTGYSILRGPTSRSTQVYPLEVSWLGKWLLAHFRGCILQLGTIFIRERALGGLPACVLGDTEPKVLTNYKPTDCNSCVQCRRSQVHIAIMSCDSLGFACLVPVSFCEVNKRQVRF